MFETLFPNIWFWIAVLFGIALLAAAVAGVINHFEAHLYRHERCIRSHVFSTSVFDKLRQKHSQLAVKDCQLAARALRTFFLTHLKNRDYLIGMPSRVVDDLWHEFILDTREYSAFCNEAFGQYFHHVPSGGLGQGSAEDKSLRRTWHYTCREENIDPFKPTRLPLLFAIDAKLQVASGFHYSLEKQEELSKKTAMERCGGGGGVAETAVMPTQARG